jgi:SNF2 family DNA or RNA helicase
LSPSAAATLEDSPRQALREFALHAAWSEGSLFLWGDRAWDDSALVSADELQQTAPAGRADRRTLLLPDGRRLSPQKVPGLRIEPAEALRFLSGIPEDEDPTIGPDLRYWSRVAKFALELLARQRFTPSIRENGEKIEARWRPVLDDPRDGDRVRLLAESLPPACRSALPGLSRRALLVDFITTLMDGAIREVWKGASSECPEDPLDRWLSALTIGDGEVTGSEAELRILRQEVEGWTSALGDGGVDAPFRTCFRLEEPARDRDRWRLAFEVQAINDPSLRVAAEKIWQGDDTTFSGASERLLADLGRASRLFDPINHALRDSAPEECLLSTEGAYRFLREASSLFEESGFGVLVPPWWKASGPRLGLHLTLQPSPGQIPGKGLFGLNMLVKFDWRIALGGETLSREEFEKLANMKVPLVRVRGQWIELKREDLDRALEALSAPGGETTLGEALRLSGSREIGLPIAGIRAEGWIADLLDARWEEIPPPAGLRAELRPYQLRGLGWLAFMRKLGLGACLADDMGLGKTVQLIAALLAASRTGPSLVLCPTSVLGNWEQEIARFAPGLKTRIHHGADRLDLFEGCDVVLTSYGIALRDHAKLGGILWDTLVLDEAQNIKNSETKQAHAARSLKARFRVALTGTPVENHLGDLWSIFEFLNPGYLGPAQTFRKSWALPIERYRDEARAESLRRLVQPFLLRRVKTDPTVIRDLPLKIETKEFCALTREQATLYKAVVEEMLEDIENSKGIERKGQVLAALSKLKQVCNHPAQFLKDGSPFAGRSGKVARIEELLDEVLAEGNRALLFTQFTAFGELLVPHFQRRFGREVLYLHGGTTLKARRALVDRFQAGDGPPLFVLSLKAGGTGLNLTEANHVFHVDRWWNPAVENQATDRAFRIGQTRNVQVHKFICRGTLEERIDEMIESKKDLAGKIVGAGESWLTELSTRELRDIFALRSDAVADG